MVKTTRNTLYVPFSWMALLMLTIISSIDLLSLVHCLAEPHKIRFPAQYRESTSKEYRSSHVFRGFKVNITIAKEPKNIKARAIYPSPLLTEGLFLTRSMSKYL